MFSPPARVDSRVEYGYGSCGKLRALFVTPSMRCVVGKYCSIAEGATVIV